MNLQLLKSLRSIARNPNIETLPAIGKHAVYQFVKTFNLFPWEVVISQSRLKTPVPNGVAALVNAQGLYDYNNMNFLVELLSEGGKFFDIGANIGSYSLLLSENEKVSVTSFEPHPFTYQCLKDNVELNGRMNVRAVHCALSSSQGSVLFSDSPGSPVNHILADGEGSGDQAAIKVVTKTASEFLEGDLDETFIVKLDVEGFEFDVLEGFGDELHLPDCFVLEVNGLSDQRSVGHQAITSLLTSAGFEGPFSVLFNEKILSREKVNREDLVFVNRRSMKQVLQKGYTVR